MLGDESEHREADLTDANEAAGLMGDLVDSFGREIGPLLSAPGRTTRGSAQIVEEEIGDSFEFDESEACHQNEESEVDEESEDSEESEEGELNEVQRRTLLDSLPNEDGSDVGDEDDDGSQRMKKKRKAVEVPSKGATTTRSGRSVKVNPLILGLTVVGVYLLRRCRTCIKVLKVQFKFLLVCSVSR